MPESAPRLAVIVPVYENWDDTVACLKALASQTCPAFEVLVSDDGSPTPPPAAVKDASPVRYLRGENVGYGANCNRAAREAIALGATHLVFLNNDAIAGPRFVERWLASIAQNSDAILSPHIYWAQDPGRIWSSGGRLTVFTPFVRSRQRFQRTAEVDVVTGCAIAVPAAAWIALNGFDTRYRMYFEDFDLTLRAKKLGIRTFLVADPELAVRHHVSGSFRHRGAWAQYYLKFASCLIFIRCHYRGVQKLTCVGLSFAHLLLTVARNFPELPNPRLLWNAMIQGFFADSSSPKPGPGE